MSTLGGLHRRVATTVAAIAGVIILATPLTPTAPAPRVLAAGGTCITDLSTASLNGMFAGQVDEYVGLDALRAFPLPDGRTLWLFQDAFFSPTGARIDSLGAARFAHNAALIQTGTCFRAIHGPTAPTDRCPNAGTASYAGGALTVNCTRWFWPMGGAMGADGYLAVFYALFGNVAGTGANTGAAADGVWVARIDPATLQVVSFVPAPDDDGTLLYGWSIQTDGDYSYLFANSYDQFNAPDRTSPPPSRNFVGRVPAGRFDLMPEYWNGTGWVADRAAARPIASGDGRMAYSMQPRLIDGVWVSVTKANDWFGSDLAVDTAPAPQGPWTRVRTMSLPTRTIDGATNNYLPHLLPWRSPLGNLVVTVSHNAWVMNPVAYANPALYRPTLFEVEPPAAMGAMVLAPSTGPLGFLPTSPQRAIDTRSAAGLAAGETRRVSLTGLVAADAEVAAVDLVGVDPSAAGFITAFACDQPRPWASNLILTAGATQAAFALVELSPAQEICLFSSTGTHLVVDVFGSYVERSAPGASSFTSGDQRRLLDTRGQGAMLVPGTPLRVPVATGTTAVAINLAATEPTAAGYVTAYPCDRAIPSTSNLNVAAGQTLSNFAQVAVSAAAELCVVSNIATHVVIDLVGNFSAAPGGWWYRATSPIRLADSREGVGVPVGPITRFVFAAAAVPANSRPALTAVPDSARALVVTAAAVDPRADGWLTVAPCNDSTAYATVALNTTAQRTTANVSVVSTPRTSGRDICIFSMMVAHHLLDMSGWYEAA
ncbi:MAG: hypothetical protein AAB131_06905 [Actinomycetota bacterium]